MERIKSGVCEMSLLESELFMREFWQKSFFFHGRKPVAWKMFMYYHDKVVSFKIAQREHA